MSIRAIDWAFRQKCKSPAQKLVLIKLADNANDEGKCWPSQGYIAEHCSMTRQTVNFHCKALAEQGLIEIVPHWIGKNRLPNTYCVRVPDATLTPCQSDTPPLSTTLTTPVNGADNPPVNGADSEPSGSEPSLEPKNSHAPRASFPDLDPILRSDLETIALTASPKTQKDAVIWARESIKYGHSVALVSSTLQAFAKAENVDKPRSWLIAVFNKLEAKHNGMEFEKEHEKRKREERDWVKMHGGSLLGLFTRGAQDGQD